MALTDDTASFLMIYAKNCSVVENNVSYYIISLYFIYVLDRWLQSRSYGVLSAQAVGLQCRLCIIDPQFVLWVFNRHRITILQPASCYYSLTCIVLLFLEQWQNLIYWIKKQYFSYRLSVGKFSSNTISHQSRTFLQNIITLRSHVIFIECLL